MVQRRWRIAPPANPPHRVPTSNVEEEVVHDQVRRGGGRVDDESIDRGPIDVHQGSRLIVAYRDRGLPDLDAVVVTGERHVVAGTRSTLRTEIHTIEVEIEAV